MLKRLEDLRRDRIEMEALLIEKEGMIAENTFRTGLDQSIAYGDKAFLVLAERMRKINLKREEKQKGEQIEMQT